MSRRINIYEMGAFQFCYFGNEYPDTLRLCIKILLVEVLIFVCRDLLKCL